MEPPETVGAGELKLERWQPRWAVEAAAAVRDSLPELMAFLPWAHAGYDVTAARDFIAYSAQSWAAGTEFNYAIFDGNDDLVGSIGLMTRMGPDVIEIGYWTRTAYAGRGHMTAAVAALTPVALALPGIERVVIRHDAANVASAAVAAKAGFVEVGREDRAPTAPGETRVGVIRERRAAEPAGGSGATRNPG
jgi:RimJ/RimL family protein N-acetyltransferase